MKLFPKTLLAAMLAMRLYGFDFHDFDAYQYRFTKEQVTTKIGCYLEKDPEIRNCYSIEEDALYIKDPKEHSIDYILYFADTPQEPVIASKPPHTRAKIAIDPGHFGGRYAKLEERFIDYGSIQFDEGTLSYQTALLLQAMLEEEGYEVLITRDGIGKGAIADSFEKWKERQPDSGPSLFRNAYNQEDLIARAAKINAFNPDITIIIHYNAHQNSITSSNYNLAFIPGAFSEHELDQAKDRYEFLRLLVTDDIEQSLKLSECIIEQFVQNLQVPVISSTDKALYIDKFCLLQKPGIFSRNLALTRFVHSPLCYGESLIQNNEEEIVRLSLCDLQVADVCCPYRVLQVATSYFAGIKQYLGK